ncbi:hypothetical protein PR202_gb13866 [Eleusine coracana subsp. coracana]|uniref:[RNA-polymerase]-subunit kinase n=1 Tax=Eleusine coracana subsp. coracana TaxID=191504 RepID=A0AAV5ETS4_ELECO|nr:hypothetical protein PR202_gb13866 [Eleusine coracana subsp. coracana]
MEHVGPSLLEVVRSQRRDEPFPEQDVRCIVRQVLGGAMALHERGVVHGAINTETVLVADYANLVVKIGGAGQATMGNAAIKEGDSWSIGCLMAELLTGKPLFDEEQGREEESLHEIFHVLGYPAADKETIHQVIIKLSSNNHDQETSTKNRLRELVPPEILSDDGFEVLQGLLTCNPNKRLTPAAALQRPWFHHLHAAPESTTTALVSLSQVGCPLALVKSTVNNARPKAHCN